MAPDQIDKLTEISKDIKTLISQDDSKRSMGRVEFWGGLILALIVNFSAISYKVGQFETIVTNHISDNAIHLSEKQQIDFVQNTAHTKEFTRRALDDIYVSHDEVLEVILDKTTKQQQNQTK